MYSRLYDLKDFQGDDINTPVQVWMGISYQQQPGDPESQDASVRNFERIVPFKATGSMDRKT